MKSAPCNPTQPHEGSTCIPTEVLEAIIRYPLSAEEYRVLFAMLRLTMSHPPQAATEEAICRLVNGRSPTAPPSR